MVLWCAVSLTGTLAFAQAAAGVSDERVNLPNAPGSISGVGENASVEGNQGALTSTVNIEVPEGFPGVTPEIAFTYSSNSGSDVLGMGWSMPNLTIERMTAKGLQQYDVDDRFVAGGGDELVRVADNGTTATYRSRFESGFVRYTWLNRGTGEGGSWKAEFPDGRVGYFGADNTGAEVATARVTVPTTTRVFRWHLVVMMDRFGHRMEASWTKDAGGTALLERLDYVFDASVAQHSVRFTYEARPDILSDAKPGFDLQLTQRLKDVRIYSGAEIVRSYSNTYEAEATSGGASRLSRVTRMGRGGLAYPVTFNFGYSQTLGGACTTDCQKPFVKAMGTLGTGAEFSQNRATLLDINGDALPDVLATAATGAHSFFYAHLDGEGQVSFATTPVASAQSSNQLVLGNPAVQVMDLNGDGFVDITNARSGDVFCNLGTGDWSAQASDCKPTNAAVSGSYALDVDVADPTQAEPSHVRFFDYDNDKRIDFLRTDTGSTTVLKNTPAGYVPVTVSTIGEVFDESLLQLADMNGDGLQDPVILRPSGAAVQVSYRLNLGFGNWSTWHDVVVSGFDASQISLIELQDINGDELTDLVAVLDGEIKLSLNRNADRFEAVRTISNANGDLASGSIPSRSGSIVLFADMNGNGSSDIVWIKSGADFTYLELFPVRPNLLARIDNGIGAVQRFSYGTSILEQARDELAAQPWVNKVPNPMTVVTAMERFVTLTGSDTSGLRERTLYRYHSGFYDGVEKQFRGYEGVERQLDADATDAQEPGLVVEAYDVGKTNPLLAGRLVKSVNWAGAAPNRVLLTETRSLWEACAASQSSNTFFACERATTTIISERDAANAVTTRQERDYDGYGNVTASRELGVVNMGTPEAPTGCAPCATSGTFGAACGDQCMGDERYRETDFIAPGALWLTGAASEERSAAVAAAWEQVTRTYYDGADFVGGALGALTLGNVTRMERKLGDDFITVESARFDAHGNEVETIDALGAVANTAAHRTLATYDSTGLRLTRRELLVGGADVDSVRMDLLTDTAWELEAQTSNWYPVKGGTPLAAPQLTRYRYDDHGRTEKILRPGDVDASPSMVFAYELADPSSRVSVTTRATASGNADLIDAQCFDGRGRMFQRRSRLSPTSWQVDGFITFDARGKPLRRYQPYLSSSGACEVAPPSSVPFTQFAYDATGRKLRETAPDGAFRSVEYGPLVTRLFDEDDNDAADPQTNTPDVRTFDGLGRVTSVARQLTTGGPLSVTTIGYDSLGLLSTVRDPAGHVHTQTADRFNRVVRVDDTNSGTTTLDYDHQGNQVLITDARGTKVQHVYDGANRLVARFDQANDAATRVTWGYDVVAGCTECTNTGNRLARITWPGTGAAGEDRFGFDARGNPVFEQRTLDGHDFITRRRFDFALRETGVTHPDGTAIDTTLDGAGRPTAVSGAVTSVEYTERGQLLRATFTNGTTDAFGYDGRMRRTSLTTGGADGNLLQLGFTLSKSGTVDAVTDGQLNGRLRRASTHTLDGWGRMTRAVLVGASGSETIDYTFDELDNLTQAVSSLGAASRANVGAYTYDAARVNAVTSAGDATMTYDQAGNLLTRGDATYTRDLLGRLATASTPKLDSTATYSDEGRVAKTEGDSTTWYLSEGFELRDGISTVYTYLAGQRVMRGQNDSLAATVLSDLAPATGSGTLTVTGDTRIDIADAWLARAASLNLVQLSGGPTPSDSAQLLRSAARRLLIEDAVWLHRDQLGTAVVATDASGEVRGERSYYPTGALRESKGFVDVRGFTDQETDEASGLLHFLHRELDPRTGRWDRPDPAFAMLTEQSLDATGEFSSAYAYVGNRFGDVVDPTGLRGERIKKFFGRVKAKHAARQQRKADEARAKKSEDRYVMIKEFDAEKSKFETGFQKVLKGVNIGAALLSLVTDGLTLAAPIADQYTDAVDGNNEWQGWLSQASSGLATLNAVSTLATRLPSAPAKQRAKEFKKQRNAFIDLHGYAPTP